MEPYLVMTFGTTNGMNYHMRVPFCIPNITANPVKISMTNIIDSNSINAGERGDLLTRQKAVYYQKSVVNFDVK